MLDREMRKWIRKIFVFSLGCSVVLKGDICLFADAAKDKEGKEPKKEEGKKDKEEEDKKEKEEEEAQLANIPALKESGILNVEFEDASSKEPPQAIVLSQIITYTLFNQWNIKISIEEINRQKGLLQIATGAFDYTFGGFERKIWKENVQVIGQKSDRSGHVEALGLSFDHTARIGTRFSLRAENTREYNPIFLINNPPYCRLNTYFVTFAIEQPLLRNFIYNPAYTTERIRRLDVASARYLMVQTVSTQLRDVVQAYWDLVAAKKIYIIERDKKKRLIDLAKKSLLLIRGGQLNATELDQQYAEIYRQDRIILFAQQSVYTALNRLLFLMGGVQGCPAIDIPNLMLEEFPDVKEALGKLHTCCLVDLAIRNRPDLTAQNYRTQGTWVQLEAAKHNLLPSLNLRVEGNVHNFALNRKACPFFGAVESRLPERDLTVELNFSVPLYNDEFIGDLRRSRAENWQSHFQETQLIEDIKYNLATAVRNHYSLIEQLKAASEAVRWYKITLKDERRKLLEGFSTIFIVLDFENRLSLAMSDEVQTYNLYARNLVELLYLTGTLVEYNCQTNQFYLSNMTHINHLFNIGKLYER